MKEKMCVKDRFIRK